MKHLRHQIFVVCVGVSISLMPHAAFAQVDPRMGTWALDVAKSSYQQGQAPSRETRTYLATDDGGLQLTANATLPSGTKQPTGFRAKLDGKDYPYSGTAGDTIAINGDAWAWDATVKMRGKIVQTSHSVIAKDGKTLTQTTKTASGRPVSTRIYNKQ